MPSVRLFLAAAAALLVPCLSASAGTMKEYQTKYYVIYSDNDEPTVKEATARVTAMAQEYYERTKDFSGKIRKRLPFYMYSNEAEYKAAGGIGAGLFAGNKLLACVPNGGGGYGWHIIQHEGFHQFVDQVMGGRVPAWVNEGLAEYFGEGLWTGDAFVTGVIAPSRLGRVKGLMKANQMKPFEQMFALSYGEWSANLDMKNYDQAWSMVHFLVNADDQKYRKAFGDFLKETSKSKDWLAAFKAHFGADLKPFEDRWRAWWTALPADPTPDLAGSAVVQIYTSFLARATVGGHAFITWEDFIAAARGGKLQADDSTWLPPGLLASAISSHACRTGTWSLDLSGKQPRVVFTRKDGTLFTGEYTVEGKEFKTRVDIKPPAK